MNWDINKIKHTVKNPNLEDKLKKSEVKLTKDRVES